MPILLPTHSHSFNNSHKHTNTQQQTQQQQQQQTTNTNYMNYNTTQNLSYNFNSSEWDGNDKGWIDSVKHRKPSLFRRYVEYKADSTFEPSSGLTLHEFTQDLHFEMSLKKQDQEAAKLANQTPMTRFRSFEREEERCFTEQAIKYGIYKVKPMDAIHGFRPSSSGYDNKAAYRKDIIRQMTTMVPIDKFQTLPSRSFPHQNWKPEMTNMRTAYKSSHTSHNNTSIHGMSKIERNADNGKLAIEKFSKEFIKSVVKARINLNLSQKLAAAKVNITENRLSSFEKGTENFDRALKSLLIWKIINEANKIIE